MSIHPPRRNGDYPDRDLDCQVAIEETFLTQTKAPGTAFVDLKRVRAAIHSQALQAGWSEAEIEAALLELIRCYALKITGIGNADDHGRRFTTIDGRSSPSGQAR